MHGFFSPPDGTFLGVKPQADPLAIFRQTVMPNGQRDDYDGNLHSLRIDAHFIANGLNIVDHRSWLAEPLRHLGSCLAYRNDLLKFRRADVLFTRLESSISPAMVPRSIMGRS